jgi:hypothetical protein
MTTDKSTLGTHHPSLATLHQLFDGLPVAPAAARHARDCPGCAHQIQALTDQRTALGRLLHREADWVSAANRAGRAVLADLLAELARACQARRETDARSAPLSELPRPIESITGDIQTLVTRLTGLAKSARSTAGRPSPWLDLERLIARRANDPALRQHAVDALRALEGPTLRWRELSPAASA